MVISFKMDCIWLPLLFLIIILLIGLPLPRMMGNGKVVYKLGIIIIYLENKENTIFLSFQEENGHLIYNNFFIFFNKTCLWLREA